MASHTGWIDITGNGVAALALLLDSGNVTLLPWDTASIPVLKRRGELIELAKTDQNALDALRALEERYKYFWIPRDLRPTLSAELLAHLYVPPMTVAAVYITSISGRLELASVEVRNRRLQTPFEELEDLPK